ncbi:hypothetical protein J6590_088850 [Homalodisca vitripennis]|nr:hypothetical protein J6590_088850 [Homalodisca vitripennis]
MIIFTARNIRLPDSLKRHWLAESDCTDFYIEVIFSFNVESREDHVWRRLERHIDRGIHGNLARIYIENFMFVRIPQTAIFS